MRLGSIITALIFAVPWAGVHMAFQARNGDSIGIGAVLRPLGFLLSCGFFFFLVWFPVLGAFVSSQFSIPARRPDAAKHLPFLFLSFLPFTVCLWLFLTTPAMARYR